MYSPDPKSTITGTGSICKKAQVKLKKEVVHGRRAREIIQQLHRPSGRACREDGNNGLIKAFCRQCEYKKF
jgi:hypothetical protein